MLIKNLTFKLAQISNYLRWFGFWTVYLQFQNKFFGIPKTISVPVAGITNPVILRLGTSDLCTHGKIFLDEEYRLNFSRPPKTIIDAGANIGLSAIYFAGKYPGATIIAIEPEQSNFLLLKQNIAPYPNIIPVQAALWYQNGHVQLLSHPQAADWSKWGFQIDDIANKNVRTVSEVEALTVDKIMRDYNLGFVDVLKIDIEGAEREVFGNPSAWIDKVGTIMIELHESIKSGCTRNFYNATNRFRSEWRQGENVIVSNEHPASGVINAP
jgi:FkbM family methyltransferase